MNTRIYNAIYSKDEIMAKRLYFSSAMVTFNPTTLICSINSPRNRPISLNDFSAEQMLEIEDYLRTYTEQPYVIEAKDNIYVILPSTYPTSSMCLFLRIEDSPNAFLRLVKEKDDFFVLSPNITLQAARMTKRLEAQKKDFLNFCYELENAFTQMCRYSLCFDDNELKDGYCEELIALSRFFAVPIDEIVINDSEDGAQTVSNFSLFATFSACMMMLAKNDALDRHIRMELDFIGGSLTVKASFKTDRKMKITNETLLWEYLASDKRMLFEYYDEEDRFCVNFRPYFIDWSYLGLKQNLTTLFEEEQEEGE